MVGVFISLYIRARLGNNDCGMSESVMYVEFYSRRRCRLSLLWMAVAVAGGVARLVCLT